MGTTYTAIQHEATIRRLAASKATYDEEQGNRGRKSGEHWARDVAEYGEPRLEQPHQGRLDVVGRHALGQVDLSRRDFTVSRGHGRIDPLIERDLAVAVAPVCRFLLNDATAEGTQSLLAENPRGVVLQRGELAGFLCSMDRHPVSVTLRERGYAMYLEWWEKLNREHEAALWRITLVSKGHPHENRVAHGAEDIAGTQTPPLLNPC